MPMFQNSQNTDTRGGTFNDVGRDQFNIGQLINNTINNTDPLALLDPVPDAVYNNLRAVSGCMAGTRQAVIEQIDRWIDGSSDQPMCWLYGAAGSGKSAISKTVAELCAEKNRLGASFFFLRGAGRRSRITNFIPTLAYHLAFSVPATRPYIESVMQREHHIVHRELEHQLRTLIIEPIQSLNTPILPMVIIVDALDECDDKGIIADFIDVVARALRNQQLPLRFLFTSRVEDHIQKKFSTSPVLNETCYLALHDFNADENIRTYFRSRFSTIYQENRRLMKDIMPPWPSEPVLTELVHKSSGSFIFAFTLVNFIENGSDLPHRNLGVALKSHAGLDPLYTQILRTARRSTHFLRIFETIMTAEEPFSVADVAYLLQIDPGDVIHALIGVQSILIVPEDDESSIRPFHTSLRDFLTSKTRSDDLFINPSVCHLSIASDCLAVMGVHDGDDFFENKRLQLVCRRWTHHLLSAIQQEGGDNLLFSRQNLNDFMRKLIGFVSQSFDSWVDSIIWEGSITETLQTLNLVVSGLEKLHQYSPDTLTTIKSIQAFAELDEQSFRKDNKLRFYISGGVFFRERREYYRGPRTFPSESGFLVATIQNWRQSQQVTTWRRFQPN